MSGFTLVDLPGLTEQREREVPRDGRGSPLIVPRAGGKAVAHTRTTTFVDCIEDKTAIGKYDRRNVLIGLSKHPAPERVLNEVKELDPEDSAHKQRMNKLCDELEVISGAHWKRDKGSHLHALSEHVDRCEALPVSTPWGMTTEEDRKDMEAYAMATLPLTIHRIEQFVVISEMLVAGTADRYAHY